MHCADAESRLITGDIYYPHRRIHIIEGLQQQGGLSNLENRSLAYELTMLNFLAPKITPYPIPEDELEKAKAELHAELADAPRNLQRINTSRTGSAIAHDSFALLVESSLEKVSTESRYQQLSPEKKAQLTGLTNGLVRRYRQESSIEAHLAEALQALPSSKKSAAVKYLFTEVIKAIAEDCGAHIPQMASAKN